MTNINETAIQSIIQSETFKVTSRSLAQQLHIKLPDAQQALLEEIYLHRHNLAEATEQLTGRQKASINYAKKDVLRNQHKSETAYIKLFEPDTDNNGNSITENTEATPARNSAYSDDEINRALTVIPMAFTETTAEFINDVLVKGSEATKQQRQMSNSQFNKKVKQSVKTAQEGNARKRLDKLLKSDTQLKLEENQQLAKTFIQMIEQEDTPAQWINNFLQEALDNKYFDEAFDATKYPGKVVKYWDTPGTRQDCYKFINEVYKLAGDRS